MAEINLTRNNNKDLKKFFILYKFESKNRTIVPFNIYENLTSSDKGLVNIFNAVYSGRIG